VVHGGSAFSLGQFEDACYENSNLIYDVVCQRWLSGGEDGMPTSQMAAPTRRLGHAAVVLAYDGGILGGVSEERMVVIGGYNGLLLASVAAFRPVVSCHNATQDRCGQIPTCIWCTNSSDGSPCHRLGCQDAADVLVTRDACATATPCSARTDCRDCASSSCQWVYEEAGLYAGLRGSCQPLLPSGAPSESSAIVRDPALCDYCGDISSCGACAGRLAQPAGARGQQLCGWYQVAAFEYPFCTLENSPIAVLSDFRTNAGTCPKPCGSLSSCASCQGVSDCVWCDSMQQCLDSRAYVQRLAYGECVRQFAQQPCQPACATNTDCTTCTADQRCGWCRDSSATDAVGYCAEGDAAGANDLNSTCYRQADSLLLPPPVDNSSSLSRAGSPWHFLSCPDVDECMSGTASCPQNSTCRNLVSDIRVGKTPAPSYECQCDTGYSEAGKLCVPVCSTYGCDTEHGLCVAPDVCQCGLGFSGSNCSDDCGCNQHARCLPNGACGQCEHNTAGPACASCLPGFVGDPTRSTSDDCMPCNALCHGHTDRCAYHKENASVTCMNCDPSSNTHGSRCQSCNDGYWNKNPVAGKTNCVPCRCNGRGTVCDPSTGLDCRCDPDTHTYTKDPLLQCSSCMTGYSLPPGNPGSYLSAGQHCYRDLWLHDQLLLEFSPPPAGPATAERLSRYAVLLPDPQRRSRTDVLLTVSVSGPDNVLVSVSDTPFSQLPLHVDLVFSCEAAAGCTPMTRNGREEGPPPQSSREGVTVSCAQANFFDNRLYVRLSSRNASVVLGAQPVKGPGRSECSQCVQHDICRAPCAAGTFRDPDARHLCRPCECNGHGDVCNVVDGGQCGLATQGCAPPDYMTQCACMDGTKSVQLRKQQHVYQYQCNRCAGDDADAVDGRPCFQDAAFNSPLLSQSTLHDGSARGQFIVVRPEKYNNIDLRLLFDVWSGALRVLVTASPAVALGVAQPEGQQQQQQPGGQVTLVNQDSSANNTVHDVILRRRQYLVIKHTEHSFDLSTRFYVSIFPAEGEVDTWYSFAVEQNQLQINLFVFFSVFFSSFMLLYVVIAVGAWAYKIRSERLQETEREIELQLMAQRPFGSVAVHLQDDAPSSPLRTDLGRPVALQPCADLRAAVATYVVQLPRGRVAFGATLVPRRRPLRLRPLRKTAAVDTTSV